MKSLVCCTHSLTRHHISHFTTFTASCWARELRVFFVKECSIHFSSCRAVVNFFEAFGTWAEEYILKRFQNDQFLVS